MPPHLSKHMDPALDLVFTRRVDVPPALIWRGWTQPDDLKKWFCPRPWQVTDCRIDLAVGGAFYTVMEGPNAERHENTGCYLEVAENRRLTWTNMLGPGLRPATPGFLPFTASISLEPDGTGTQYRALAMHRTPEDRKTHADMGFEQGWGIALDQLVELAKGW